MSKKRVVITGLGAVTPLGASLHDFWQGLLAGRSGVRRITRFDPTPFACQIAGEVPDFDPIAYLSRKEARHTPRSAQMAFGAALQALEDAALPLPLADTTRGGVVVGTAMGGIDMMESGIQTMRRRGPQRVSPFILPGAIPNLSAFLIARHTAFTGPNFTVSTACASGTQAIGTAAELIRSGKVDVAIAGGTEALVQDYAIAGFEAMHALVTGYNHAPERASRPFDADRQGFVFSEGAGMLVLESLEHAMARGAHVYAEVLGQAATTDAYHIAAPHPQARGRVQAMQQALADAGLRPEQVDYISAHGTGTVLNDLSETQAIKHVFGEHAYRIPVSAIKSMLGHAMGAAGALEAIACALSLQGQVIPPTINYETPDPQCDLDYVPNQARKHAMQYALSNSFGLGGQNACLVFARWPDSHCNEGDSFPQ
ncbi:MAG: beta-ketoacyl-[acyl-carrier-protein] synthase II [Anaerolineae bacterium]|nr:MAG: beta-ketoacyl-[acyl-carrier-protein] synthase II [Anaerolineae bacterium]